MRSRTSTRIERKILFRLLLVSFLSFPSISIAQTSSSGTATSPQPLHGLVAKMAKIVAAAPKDGPNGLQKLSYELEGYELQGIMYPVFYQKEFLNVVSDKTQDWRLRYFCAGAMSEWTTKAIVKPLMKIVLDKTERPELRGAAAVGLTTAVTTNPKLKRVFEQLAANPNTPKPLFDKVMMVLGSAGSDDLNLMERLAGMPVDGQAALGSNFNAIRAIGASNNPQALEVLTEMLQAPPDIPLARGVVLQTLLSYAKTPNKVKKWPPELVPALLKMLGTRKYKPTDKIQTNQVFANSPDIIRLLGLIGSRRAVPRLVEFLNYPDTVVVAAAAQALGRIGDPRALPHVQELWNGLGTDPRENYDFAKRFKYWKNHCEHKKYCVDLITPQIYTALNSLKAAAKQQGESGKEKR